MYLSCEKERSPKRCIFWKKGKAGRSRCTFNDGQCSSTVEQCIGCKYVDKIGSKQNETSDTRKMFCLVYMNPLALWNSGKCPMFEDPNAVAEEEKKKKMLNPMKASKKGRKLV